MGLVDLNGVRQYAEDLEDFDVVPTSEPEFQPGQEKEEVVHIHQVQTPRQSVAQFVENQQILARQTRAVIVRLLALGLAVLGLAGIYLMREERVAAASAEVSKINREIESLLVTLDAKRTAFECSTDLNRIREIANKKLGMNYPSEDQINYIDYETIDDSLGPVEMTPVTLSFEDNGPELEMEFDLAGLISMPQEVTIEIEEEIEDDNETAQDEIENGITEDELSPELMENGEELVVIPEEVVDESLVFDLR